MPTNDPTEQLIAEFEAVCCGGHTMFPSARAALLQRGRSYILQSIASRRAYLQDISDRQEALGLPIDEPPVARPAAPVARKPAAPAPKPAASKRAVPNWSLPHALREARATLAECAVKRSQHATEASRRVAEALRPVTYESVTATGDRRSVAVVRTTCVGRAVIRQEFSTRAAEANPFDQMRAGQQPTIASTIAEMKARRGEQPKRGVSFDGRVQRFGVPVSK
jgi:hypothetical protein